MEQINLHNYEAFFLDYLEDNLDKSGRIQLEKFLAEHPALEEELKEMGGLDELVLVPEDKSLGDKSFLKGGDQLNRLTEEQWMVKAIEGELSDAEFNQLKQHITQHSLEKTFKAYQLTKLKANPFVLLQDKETLKRKEAAIIPLWLKYSAAASVLILFGLFGFSLFQNEQNNEVSAMNDLNKVELGARTKLAFSIKQFSSESGELNPQYTYPNNTEEFLAQENNTPPAVDSLPIQAYENLPELKDDPIAQLPQTLLDTIQKNIPVHLHDIDNDDIVVAVQQESDIVTEEPFKMITNATANLLNKEIQYTRDRKVQDNEYVAHHFKLGKFEFERKKRK